VSEQPDSSSLQARVCGSMAEKLQGLSWSVLWYHGEPHMAQGGVGASPIQSHKADPAINAKRH
jgi:hypothetical protein